LRLTSTIIAVLLALSMVAFPISMVRAAALGSHNHAETAQAEHGDHHTQVASSEADCVSTATVHHDQAAPADDASHKSGPSCCGMGACHAFQLSGTPSLLMPAAMAHVLHAPGDEQVTGSFSVRIDRPPRTV
jgi:hypothetical protein